MTTPLVFEFRDVTAARPAGGPALRAVTWAVRDGETWAVVGPTGSGKSTLAALVAGKLVVRAGTAVWPPFRPVPAEHVHLVAFQEDGRLFSYRNHYYQQRFNIVERDEDLSLDAYLRAGFRGPDADITAAAGRLGVDRLRPLSFLKLSNGQTRRARIARGLLARPELLILDDPFMGLDAAGRDDLAALLGELVRGGQRLLLVTRPDAVPDWATHVAAVADMTIAWKGPRADYSPPRAEPMPLGGGSAPARDAPPVVELRDVTVSYNGRPVLDRVTWTVRAGERWAVVGPNGSGKTTLLSLLCGDHPQAYANDVRLFGRRRGTGESIWDVKRAVGLVSPELHLYFTAPLLAADAAATGFADVVTFRPSTPEQKQRVAELFAQFGLTGVADRPFARLSAGEQRLVLLVRALVKRPPLVVLDEPFQGLDATAVAAARGWLDRHLGPDQTLLFVTHHPAEVPASVTRRLRLDAGRVAEIA